MIYELDIFKENAIQCSVMIYADLKNMLRLIVAYDIFYISQRFYNNVLLVNGYRGYVRYDKTVSALFYNLRRTIEKIGYTDDIGFVLIAWLLYGWNPLFWTLLDTICIINIIYDYLDELETRSSELSSYLTKFVDSYVVYNERFCAIVPKDFCVCQLRYVNHCMLCGRL